MRGILLAAAALAGVAISAPAATAQISSGGGPIAYSADNLDYIEGQRQLILTGNVDVTQDDTRLQADKMTLYFRAGPSADAAMGSGDIERIIAEGQVFYVRPEQKARGDRAVYETASDTVTFTGNVIVASDDNVIRGNVMTLNISNKRTTIRPSRPGERVQGVFAGRPAKKKQ